jgi:hypothetical protein
MQLGKLRLIVKPTNRATARAIDSIMDRHMKKQKSYMTDRWQTGATDDRGTWIGSLLEYLAEAGHQLVRPYDWVTNILDLHISLLAPDWIPDPSLPIERIGDVLDTEYGNQFIIPSVKLLREGQPLPRNLWQMQNVPGLLLPDGASSIHHMPLYIRKGQYWLQQDQHDNISRMFQITGWTDTMIHGFEINLAAKGTRYRTGKQIKVNREIVSPSLYRPSWSLTGKQWYPNMGLWKSAILPKSPQRLDLPVPLFLAPYRCLCRMMH